MELQKRVDTRSFFPKKKDGELSTVISAEADHSAPVASAVPAPSARQNVVQISTRASTSLITKNEPFHNRNR